MVITRISMMMSLRTHICRQGDDALSDGHQHGPAAVLPQVKRSQRCDHDKMLKIEFSQNIDYILSLVPQQCPKRTKIKKMRCLEVIEMVF